MAGFSAVKSSNESSSMRRQTEPAAVDREPLAVRFGVFPRHAALVDRLLPLEVRDLVGDEAGRVHGVRLQVREAGRDRIRHRPGGEVRIGRLDRSRHARVDLDRRQARVGRFLEVGAGVGRDRIGLAVVLHRSGVDQHRLVGRLDAEDTVAAGQRKSAAERLRDAR
jgi:hypothetical protein